MPSIGLQLTNLSIILDGLVPSNSSKPSIKAGAGIKNRIALVTSSRYSVAYPFVILLVLMAVSQLVDCSDFSARKGMMKGTYLLKPGFSSKDNLESGQTCISLKADEAPIV